MKKISFRKTRMSGKEPHICFSCEKTTVVDPNSIVVQNRSFQTICCPTPDQKLMIMINYGSR